jgi:hypothetical protein
VRALFYLWRRRRRRKEKIREGSRRDARALTGCTAENRFAICWPSAPVGGM